MLGYIQRQLGLPIASTAPLGKITDAFSAAMRRFARDHDVPWVDFVKGQRKDDVMHEHLARFDRQEGVLFIGRAQEKTSLFRTERRRDANGDSYPWIVRATGVVNQFYVYAVDRDFGPFFLKFCSYFPYNAKLCLNGHEWAKRQAAKAGIGFTALDNGFASCADPAAVQAICDRLGVEQIDGLLRKWLAVLPHPFSPADREAGYRYDISILQAEFSLTQMLDRPVSGWVFFEHVIRDNLDAGRPDQVSLIFDRKLRRTGPRATPGRFRTRVITEGEVLQRHGGQPQFVRERANDHHEHHSLRALGPARPGVVRAALDDRVAEAHACTGPDVEQQPRPTLSQGHLTRRQLSRARRVYRVGRHHATALGHARSIEQCMRSELHDAHDGPVTVTKSPSRMST